MPKRLCSIGACLQFQIDARVGGFVACRAVSHDQKRAGRWQSSPSSTERFQRSRRFPNFVFGEGWRMGSEAAQRYKEYGAECLLIAQQATDPAQKMRLLEMAESWQRLAQVASKHDQ